MLLPSPATTGPDGTSTATARCLGARGRACSPAGHRGSTPRARHLGRDRTRHGGSRRHGLPGAGAQHLLAHPAVAADVLQAAGSQRAAEARKQPEPGPRLAALPAHSYSAAPPPQRRGGPGLRQPFALRPRPAPRRQPRASPRPARSAGGCSRPRCASPPARGAVRDLSNAGMEQFTKAVRSNSPKITPLQSKSDL